MFRHELEVLQRQEEEESVDEEEAVSALAMTEDGDDAGMDDFVDDDDDVEEEELDAEQVEADVKQLEDILRASQHQQPPPPPAQPQRVSRNGRSSSSASSPRAAASDIPQLPAGAFAVHPALADDRAASLSVSSLSSLLSANAAYQRDIAAAQAELRERLSQLSEQRRQLLAIYQHSSLSIAASSSPSSPSSIPRSLAVSASGCAVLHALADADAAALRLCLASRLPASYTRCPSSLCELERE